MLTRNAASVAASIHFSFPKTNLALLVGICGGVPFSTEQTEIILGDVLISDKVIEYDFGRQCPDGFQRKGAVMDILGPSNRNVRSLLSGLKTRMTHDQLQGRLLECLEQLQRNPNSKWLYPGKAQDQLFPASYRHKHYHAAATDCICANCQTSRDPVCDEVIESDCSKLGCIGDFIPRTRLSAAHPEPHVHFGVMASADSVMKSGEHRDQLVETEKVIGFEMEGAGILGNLPCIIVKGVCDYADSHKNKVWQDYAAATAAACAKAFIEAWPGSTKNCK
jgi:nucleoside phosphorylase